MTSNACKSLYLVSIVFATSSPRRNFVITEPIGIAPTRGSSISIPKALTTVFLTASPNSPRAPPVTKFLKIGSALVAIKFFFSSIVSASTIFFSKSFPKRTPNLSFIVSTDLKLDKIELTNDLHAVCTATSIPFCAN